MTKKYIKTLPLIKIFLNNGVNFINPFCNALLKNKKYAPKINKSIQKNMLFLPYSVENRNDTIKNLLPLYWVDMALNNDCYFFESLDSGKKNRIGDKRYEKCMQALEKNPYGRFEKIFVRIRQFINGKSYVPNEFDLMFLAQAKKIMVFPAGNEKAITSKVDALFFLIEKLNFTIRMSFFINFNLQKLMFEIPSAVLDVISVDNEPFGDYIPKNLIENMPASCFAIAFDCVSLVEEKHLSLIGYLVQKGDEIGSIDIFLLFSNEKGELSTRHTFIDYQTTNKISDVAMHNVHRYFLKDDEKTITLHKGFFKKYSDKYNEPKHLAVYADYRKTFNLMCSILFLLQDEPEFAEKTKIFVKEVEKKKIYFKKNINSKKNNMLCFRRGINSVTACDTLKKQMLEMNKVSDEHVKKHNVRPHVRRGHLHTFWTGKRKDGAVQKSIHKWVKPMLVGLIK